MKPTEYDTGAHAYDELARIGRERGKGDRWHNAACRAFDQLDQAQRNAGADGAMRRDVMLHAATVAADANINGAQGAIEGRQRLPISARIDLNALASFDDCLTAAIEASPYPNDSDAHIANMRALRELPATVSAAAAYGYFVALDALPNDGLTAALDALNERYSDAAIIAHIGNALATDVEGDCQTRALGALLVALANNGERGLTYTDVDQAYRAYVNADDERGDR